MNRRWLKHVADDRSELHWSSSASRRSDWSCRRRAQEAPPEDKKDQAEEQKAKADPAVEERERERAIDKLFEEYDLKPHPPAPIPDDPPPHEGAMISVPNIIEPPDLVLIEVLEALPGRPISGERLVRPDGKISLGFYGDIEVRGLTIEQVKVKVIKQMRKYLTDDVLGLIEVKVEVPEALPAPPEPAKPGAPGEEKLPKKDGAKAKKISAGRGGLPALRRTLPQPSDDRVRPPGKVRLLASRQEKKAEEPVRPIPEEPRKPIRIPLDAGGQITITIEIQAGEKKQEEVPAEAPELVFGAPVKPAESEKVFVDVTAYNSANYYVLGDVAAPGRLPWTGKETILDALQFTGGLLRHGRAQGHPSRPTRAGRQAGQGVQGQPGGHPEGRHHCELPDLPRRPTDHRPQRRGQEDGRDRPGGRRDADGRELDNAGGLRAPLPHGRQPREARPDPPRPGRVLDPGDEASRRRQARRADPPRGPPQAAPDPAREEVETRTWAAIQQRDSKHLESTPPQDRPNMLKAVVKWKQERDLAGVRDAMPCQARRARSEGEAIALVGGRCVYRQGRQSVVRRRTTCRSRFFKTLVGAARIL